MSHNPQSNMKISSGIAPIARMHSEGVLCTIGTDGTCSNNDLDMWDEMRTASFLQNLRSQRALLRRDAGNASPENLTMRYPYFALEGIRLPRKTELKAISV